MSNINLNKLKIKYNPNQKIFYIREKKRKVVIISDEIMWVELHDVWGEQILYVTKSGYPIDNATVVFLSKDKAYEYAEKLIEKMKLHTFIKLKIV